MPPVARLGDACVSPSGKPGTITTGSDTFWVDARKAARLGDLVTYVDGSTTTIAEGDPGLVVDAGRGAARLGYRLADGGRIVMGSPRATSDSPYPGAGTVAEQTMLAAREHGLAFVPTNCERVGAAALHDPTPVPPPDPVGPDTIEIHSDLADGGAPSLFRLDGAEGDPA